MLDDALRQEEKPVLKQRERMKRVIAVMSGKGGTGKTTVAVNLALLLAERAATGLLDADIDCPNVGAMLGIDQAFEPTANRMLTPITFGTLKVASMAFFGQGAVPHAWRGPIIHKALLQLIELVDWGVLEYMVIDMPPGTSDAAITLLQSVKPSAAIIVTTPSSLARQDAIRTATLLQQHGVPFGVVENMSGAVFGSGTAKLAQELGAPFLGSLPLDKKIRESADTHEPIVLKDKKLRKEFEAIATKMNVLL